MIVVNDNYRLAPWADALYAADPQWWRVHIERVRAVFSGMLWSQAKREDKRPERMAGVQYVESIEAPGLSEDPTCLHRGNNSGFQALNLAYLLGAVRFILLGYDMQMTGARRHWFGDHPAPLRNTSAYGSFAKAFYRVRSDLDIVNCSRATALTCFPRADIREALP